MYIYIYIYIHIHVLSEMSSDLGGHLSHTPHGRGSFSAREDTQHGIPSHKSLHP